MKQALTILFGFVLILLLTPLAQYSTIALTNHDLETSAVSGWAFGILTSLVLALAAFRMVKKNWVGDRKGLVLLFCMLSMAVPVMNLGFARLLIHSLSAVQDHFLLFGVDTYRRAYQEGDPDWIPTVPTKEGLARAKAESGLRLLVDRETVQQRRAALQEVNLLLQRTERTLERGGALDDAFAGQWSGLLGRMGLQELERLQRDVQRFQRVAPLVAADPELDQRIETLRSESRKALAYLKAEVPEEPVLYWSPFLREHVLDSASLGRLQVQEGFMDPDHLSTLREQGQVLDQERVVTLQTAVGALGSREETELITAQAQRYLKAWEELSDAELAVIRTEFLHRLRTSDRKALFAGSDADMTGLKEGALQNREDLEQFREQSIASRVKVIGERIPWQVWSGPLLRWALVGSSWIFFFTCLAEWLRRKWVDRENLAFPLVEVADQLIRHDYALERSEDLLHPEKRTRMFPPVFWGGFALGALLLLAEAVSYYQGGSESVLGLDVTKNLFGSGVLQNFNEFVFILSPILLGLFFLVSLEISFSVWMIFLLYRIVWFAMEQGSEGGIRDSGYVGWASKGFPFEQEQLLGAGLAMAVLLLVKAWGAGKQKPAAGTAVSSKGIPTGVMRAGLFACPLLLMGLFWDLGMQQPLLFLLSFAVMVLLAVTAARLRAETGLPLQHVSYDFTRLPLVFGFSRVTSVKSFLSFIPLVFLPVTLLTRLLPQQLENFELARRHRMSGTTVAFAGLSAAIFALVWGLISLLFMSHWLGEEVLGTGAEGGIRTASLMAYPLWVTHFLGEEGLASFTELHRTRLLFVGVGALVFAALTLIRKKVLSFPLHPLGYLLVLFSIYSNWLSPYHKGTSSLNLDGASWLWGSALVAWILKRLIIKYGGMNSYRAAKPAFIGLIVGSVFTLFVINSLDLIVSMRGDAGSEASGALEKTFQETPSFTPAVY